ncbi:hypothetical protein EB796_003161 [Bugula neritina]|uniref:Uncharacterized protein n=1 Tax=Bugula neritina TaxID=10212 RepID=A0A7J7KKJ4_BUGNE|nr:hypothetical protein EB796_003161 [Bugula neritina]
MKIVFLVSVIAVCLMTFDPATEAAHTLAVVSTSTVKQSIIIMKVLFLVVVIAVCLMTFAPATEARRPPPKRCCKYKYKKVCHRVGYQLKCYRKKVCARYCYP